MERSRLMTRTLVATTLCLAGTAAFAAASVSEADAVGAKVKAAAESRGPEVSIPFADHGGIRNWRAVDRDTLLIEGRNRKWYRAELMGGCFDLPFAQQVGFKANPSGDFDRFSSVYVRGQHCRVVSLTETAAPAKRTRKDSAASAAGGATGAPAKPAAQ